MPEQPLYLILGSDAFSHLSTWHQWKQLLDLSHIIVIARPEQPLSLPEEMTSWYQDHLAILEDTALLTGKIWPVTLTQLNISASAIRRDLVKGRSPAFLMPDTVVSFIEQLGLYQ